jgi:hypothetical protein
MTTTARTITLGSNQLGTGRQQQVFPAGTRVVVGRERNGFLRIRVAGTLFEQDVTADSLAS